MNAIRNIILTIVVFVVIALVYSLIPLAIIGLISMSKFWLIILLIFFSGLAIAAFQLLPGGITWLCSKITPNKTFSFYTIFTISALLGIYSIYDYWTNSLISKDSIGTFFSLIFTCLTIGFATSFSVGAGIELQEKRKNIFSALLLAGSIIFYIGIFLVFCLLTLKICSISPNKTYKWYSGIWHGIFVIPNWILSWFFDGIYCKAPLRTSAYHVWWWISFIFIGLSIFGGRKNHSNKEQEL